MIHILWRCFCLHLASSATDLLTWNIRVNFLFLFPLLENWSFFSATTHNLRKSLGTIVAQKRKSIDKNQRSQGTFQTWSQTHKSWKTHVKKAERTFTLCCSAQYKRVSSFFFLVSNLHLSESCASVVLVYY